MPGRPWQSRFGRRLPWVALFFALSGLDARTPSNPGENAWLAAISQVFPEQKARPLPGIGPLLSGWSVFSVSSCAKDAVAGSRRAPACE